MEQEAFWECENSGLLGAYLEAVFRQNSEKVGKEKGSIYLATFFRKMQRAKMPDKAYRFFLQQYCGVLEFFEYRDVILITANGEPKAFCPRKELLNWEKLGTPLEQQHNQIRARSSDSKTNPGWRRGRYGYAPVNSKLFKEELRKPSKGAFDLG